jgi:hypothetical protein
MKTATDRALDEATRYYYRRNEHWLGPFPLGELARLRSAGTLTAETPLLPSLPLSVRGGPTSVAAVLGKGASGGGTGDSLRSGGVLPRVEARAGGDSRLEVAEGRIRLAEKGVDRLGAIAKASKEFARDATAATDLTKIAGAFGNLAPVLGAFGVGLSIASGVVSLFVQSDSEKMLEMLQQILDKVDSLRGDVETRLKRIQDMAIETAARSQVLPHVTSLDAYVGAFREYCNGAQELAGMTEGTDEWRRKATDVGSQRSDLEKLNPLKDVKVCVHGLMTAMTAADDDLAFNLLEAAQKESYGDLIELCQFAFRLLDLAAASVVMVGTLKGWEWQTKNPGRTPDAFEAAGLSDALARDYAYPLEAMATAAVTQTIRCVEDLRPNLERQLDDVIATTALKEDWIRPRELHGYAAMAQKLLGDIQVRHSWCDFTVVVYEPKPAEFTRWCVVDPAARTLVRCRARFSNGACANVVVRYDVRAVPAEAGETPAGKENPAPAEGERSAGPGRMPLSKVPRVAEFLHAVAGTWGEEGVERYDSPDANWKPLLEKIAGGWGSWAVGVQQILVADRKRIGDLVRHYPAFCCNLWTLREQAIGASKTTGEQPLPYAAVFVTKDCTRLFHATTNADLVAVLSTGRYSACIVGDGGQPPERKAE